MKRLKSRSVCQCTSAKRVGCKVSAQAATAPATTLGWNKLLVPVTVGAHRALTSATATGHSPRPAATLDSSSFFRNLNLNTPPSQ
jgi:hypothetical protein